MLDGPLLAGAVARRITCDARAPAIMLRSCPYYDGLSPLQPLLRPADAQAEGAWAVPLGSRFTPPYDKAPKTPV